MRSEEDDRGAAQGPLCLGVVGGVATLVEASTCSAQKCSALDLTCALS